MPSNSESRRWFWARFTMSKPISLRSPATSWVPTNPFSGPSNAFRSASSPSMFPTARSASRTISSTACTSGSASRDAGRLIIRSPTPARVNSPRMVIARSLSSRGGKSAWAHAPGAIARLYARTNVKQVNPRPGLAVRFGKSCRCMALPPGPIVNRTIQGHVREYNIRRLRFSRVRVESPPCAHVTSALPRNTVIRTSDEDL